MIWQYLHGGQNEKGGCYLCQELCQPWSSVMKTWWRLDGGQNEKGGCYLCRELCQPWSSVMKTWSWEWSSYLQGLEAAIQRSGCWSGANSKSLVNTNNALTYHSLSWTFAFTFPIVSEDSISMAMVFPKTHCDWMREIGREQQGLWCEWIWMVSLYHIWWMRVYYQSTIYNK